MGRPERKSTNETKKFAENLSELVENAKKKSGLKQKEIANAIGVSSGALSEWCSDQKTVSADNLVLISKYFDVSIDWLLGISNLRTTKEDIKSACITTGLSERSMELLGVAKDHEVLHEAIDGLNVLLEDSQTYFALSEVSKMRKYVADWTSRVKDDPESIDDENNRAKTIKANCDFADRIEVLSGTERLDYLEQKTFEEMRDAIRDATNIGELQHLIYTHKQNFIMELLNQNNNP